MKDRKLLMIPGPIEFTPEVLRAMGMATTSHVAPNFIEAFGQALERLREAPGRQPLPTRSGIPECPTSSEPESGDAGNPSG